MVRKYKPKGRRPVDELIMESAIEMVKAGASIRSAAKNYGLHEATIRVRMKRETPSAKLGGTIAIPEDEEANLAYLLTLKSKWGFASTREEVKCLVQEFVQSNRGKDTDLSKHLDKFCRFKVRVIER